MLLAATLLRDGRGVSPVAQSAAAASVVRAATTRAAHGSRSGQVLACLASLNCTRGRLFSQVSTHARGRAQMASGRDASTVPSMSRSVSPFLQQHFKNQSQPQRRSYRLLPSQTLSLVEAHIPAALSSDQSGHASRPQIFLASSAEDVREAVRALATFPLELQADVLDLVPAQGLFSINKALDVDTKETQRPALRGAKQLVWNEDEAVTLARLWLDEATTFSSAAQPYIRKKTPAVIVRKAPRSHEGSAATCVRFIVTASRDAHAAGGSGGGGNGVFFGPTLTVLAGPSSLSSGTAQHLDPQASITVGIDVSALQKAKAIGEVSSLADEQGSVGDSKADRALAQVAATSAEAAWKQQVPHIGLEDGAKDAFLNIAKQAIATFWRGDGDRFVLDVMVPRSSSPSSDAAAVELVAAEMQFDDDSLARQKTLSAMRQDGSRMWDASETAKQATPMNAVKHELHELEELAEKSGMVYRKHRNGNVGLFGYGAGMGMGTVDGLIEEGGRPANFFDGGGGASIENSKEAMRILSLDPDVKCILVNIFGGITRSDLVSQGIIEAYREFDIKVPLVCRFRGNKAQEAQATLRESNLNVELFDDYRPAAKRASEIADAASANVAAKAAQPQKSKTASKGTSSRKKSARQTRGYSTVAHDHGSNVQALVGYAFAGKPRQSEAQITADAVRGSTLPPPLPRQGFPSASPIGSWVDAMLRNGEAGEDALLVSKMRGQGDWVLAVADGVGGWSENGVDPALFSQALMYHAGEYAQRFFACPQRLDTEDSELAKDSVPTSPLSTPPPSPDPASPAYNVEAADAGTPVDILQYAYQQTLSQREVPAGSATACIVTFDSSKGMLRSANLGDSGLLVLRPGSKAKLQRGALRRGSQEQPASTSASEAESTSADEESASENMHAVFYQSKPQTHGFNTPLQLSKLPPEYRFENSIDSQPFHAATWNARVRDGDIVLLATDGFWDNVSTSEILQLVAFIRDKHHTAWLEEKKDKVTDKGALNTADDALAEERDLANVLAHNLLSYARMCQNSTTKTSPFERDAAKHGIHYPGGKVDDVAILVSLIVER